MNLQYLNIYARRVLLITMEILSIGNKSKINFTCNSPIIIFILLDLVPITVKILYPFINWDRVSKLVFIMLLIRYHILSNICKWRNGCHGLRKSPAPNCSHELHLVEEFLGYKASLFSMKKLVLCSLIFSFLIILLYIYTFNMNSQFWLHNLITSLIKKEP